MAFPRQCCRDSVAMKLQAMTGPPYEGLRVECRWGGDCYAVFMNGAWDFHDDLSDRIDRMTSPEATAQRAARMREILRKDLD